MITEKKRPIQIFNVTLPNRLIFSIITDAKITINNKYNGYDINFKSCRSISTSE